MDYPGHRPNNPPRSLNQRDLLSPTNPEMIPDKVPQEGVYHASEDLKKESHIGSYDKYKELYLRSIESPEGESRVPWGL